MYSAAAGWLHQQVSRTSPLLVSLVQVARAACRCFCCALPAGALADIIDRRRFYSQSRDCCGRNLGRICCAGHRKFGLWPQNAFAVHVFYRLTRRFRGSQRGKPSFPALWLEEDLSSAIAAGGVGAAIIQPRCGPRARWHHHRILWNSRTVLARCIQQLWCNHCISMVAITSRSPHVPSQQKES